MTLACTANRQQPHQLCPMCFSYTVNYEYEIVQPPLILKEEYGVLIVRDIGTIFYQLKMSNVVGKTSLINGKYSLNIILNLKTWYPLSRQICLTLIVNIFDFLLCICGYMWDMDISLLSKTLFHRHCFTVTSRLRGKAI